jgi:hypothetical protein
LPGERYERRLGIGHLDVGQAGARIVVGDRGRYEADSAAGGDQGEDLLDAGRLGCDVAREAGISMIRSGDTYAIRANWSGACFVACLINEAIKRVSLLTCSFLE